MVLLPALDRCSTSSRPISSTSHCHHAEWSILLLLGRLSSNRYASPPGIPPPPLNAGWHQKGEEPRASFFFCWTGPGGLPSTSDTWSTGRRSESRTFAPGLNPPQVRCDDVSVPCCHRSYHGYFAGGPFDPRLCLRKSRTWLLRWCSSSWLRLRTLALREQLAIRPHSRELVRPSHQSSFAVLRVPLNPLQHVAKHAVPYL